LQQALPLGTTSLARQWMRHTPPTPLDIEHAIEQTEDVVMPLAKKLPRTDQLQLSGTGAALILQGVDAAPNAALRWSLDEVEDLFNRLAMVSQGRPSGQEALPTAPEFYAAMVIVRECLHHLRFTGVVIGGLFRLPH
jgi:exopolyphosphatase/pppGpp-phosphohydrolase